MVEFTLFFDDWRDADGIKFPHKMRRAMGGATNEEWTVSKVKVNPKIDPKKFAAESGAVNVTRYRNRAGGSLPAGALSVGQRMGAAPADRHAPRHRQGSERRSDS